MPSARRKSKRDPNKMPAAGSPHGDPIAVQKYRAAWFRLAERETERFNLERSVNLALPRSGIEALQDPVGAGVGQLLDKHDRQLIHDYPGTSGVALSLRYHHDEILSNEPCLTFFVKNKAAARNIPPSIQGLPTDVVQMGTPVLLSSGIHK